MTDIISVGLDGAAWHKLDRLMDAGRLPNLSEVVETGVRAPLRSITPPVTCPAWRCSTSGKNPGKVGVFWWQNLDHDAGTISTPNSDSFATADVWDYLSAEGRRCGVLNVPMTYPPSEVNGTMVSGFGASFDYEENPDDSITYPPSFESELADDYNWRTGVEDVTTDAGLEQTYDIIRSRFELLLDMADRDYDYLHLTVFYINALQHKYGDGEETNRAWELIDEYLGQIDTDETRLVIYSDHGHQAIDSTFVLNRWLMEKGYLTLESKSGDSVTGGLYAGLNAVNVSPKKMAVLARRVLPESIHDRLIPSTYPISTLRLAERVDWEETDALAFSQGPLYLNRDRLGDQYEQVRESLRRDLVELTHDGSDVIANARTAEEIYNGPYVDEAPDILLTSADGWEIYGGIVPSTFESQVMSWTSGNHPVGILAANGPNVEPAELSEQSILDVAPTVLHSLGSSVPNDMDGSVIEEIVPAQSPVSFREPISASPLGEQATDEELEDRLVDLGYLE